MKIKAEIVGTKGEARAEAKEWVQGSSPQNFWSPHPLKLMKIIDNTKELVLMGIISIDI